MKSYVFRFHYNKPKNKMTVHWKNVCHIVDEIICYRPCRSHWSDRQPRLVMKGLTRGIKFTEVNGKTYAVIN